MIPKHYFLKELQLNAQKNIWNESWKQRTDHKEKKRTDWTKQSLNKWMLSCFLKVSTHLESNGRAFQSWRPTTYQTHSLLFFLGQRTINNSWLDILGLQCLVNVAWCLTMQGPSREHAPPPIVERGTNQSFYLLAKTQSLAHRNEKIMEGKFYRRRSEPRLPIIFGTTLFYSWGNSVEQTVFPHFKVQMKSIIEYHLHNSGRQYL